MSWYLIYCFIFNLGVFAVLPTIWGTFIFDDTEAILKNSDVTGEGSTLLDVFKHDFWGIELTNVHSHKSYRPLTTLMFRWNFGVWGNTAFPFHVINIVLHGFNCVLVYIFLLKCTKTAMGHGDFDLRSFWASILFAVHPVHVEPLGSLVGSADLLSSLVFLTGFILQNEPKTSSFIYIAILAIFGSFFKENAIVLVLFYITADMANRTRRNPCKLDVYNYCVALISITVFVLLRLWLQDGAPVFQSFDNPPMFAMTHFSKICSVLYIWILNIFVLVCPIWLCYDWSMGCVSLITSPLDIRFGVVLISLIVGLRLLFLSFHHRKLLISILIFTTTFFPSSNIMFTVGFVLAERNLYLPSIGYAFLISNEFFKKKKKFWFYFIVTIFFFRSIHRSFQWTDQSIIFSSGLNVCPNNAKVHYNLGTSYGGAGDIQNAIRSYRSALDLRPNYYQAMNNLGNILRLSGNLKEAEMWLRRALEIKEDFAAAWMNLGIVLSKQNATEAFYCYTQALSFRTYYPDCEYNLGNLYLDVGEKELALKSWMKAIALKPTHSQAWINVLISLEQDGNLLEAKSLGYRASRILTNDDTVQFLLGNILGKLGEYQEAKNHFENSINFCARQGKSIPSKYWSNLGVLYHRWGKRNEAINSYREALRLDKTLISVQRNIDTLETQL